MIVLIPEDKKVFFVEREIYLVCVNFLNGNCFVSTVVCVGTGKKGSLKKVEEIVLGNHYLTGSREQLYEPPIRVNFIVVLFQLSIFLGTVDYIMKRVSILKSDYITRISG